MSVKIPNVSRDDLASWALAQMYRSMVLAEKAYADYCVNSGNLPTDNLSDIASEIQMHTRNAHMYAAIFSAAELAAGSIRFRKYQDTIESVDAFLASKQIPPQRTNRAK